MKFKTYELEVCFGEGRYANGTYSVKAITEQGAIDRGLREICDKLYSVLPELDIEVSVRVVSVIE